MGGEGQIESQRGGGRHVFCPEDKKHGRKANFAATWKGWTLSIPLATQVSCRRKEKSPDADFVWAQFGRGGHFRCRFGASSPPEYKRKESERELRPDSVWWRRVDSNHRSETQQIYSLPPLATRELLHMKLWSWWTDSNPRPADYKSAALPAELHQHLSRRLSNSKGYYNRRLGFCQVLF